jgi:voltage-gated potassium channel
MSLMTQWRDWRVKVHEVLEVDSDTPASRSVNAFLIVLILANGVAFAAETVDSLAAKYGPEFEAFNTFSVIVFTIEYVLRLWGAVEIPMFRGLPHWRARLRFALRPMMLIDLMAFLPWYVYSIFPVDLRAFRVVRIFRLLKLLRYSPALETLKRVVINERRALLGGLLLMMVLLLFTSTIIYFLERDAQPTAFGSVPAAAWWALATLTTIGYGDIVPTTPWGKVFGGLVMLIGLGMFALPIAIISAGFSQESARNEFVASWTAVARIPLFSGLKANEIAEISKLLYTRLVQPGAAIVTSGQSGGAMYFIGSGEASVQVPPGRRVELHEGDFFGEMALLEHRRHKHDVIADTSCRVFVLDSEALARLSRRHPEIPRHIREVAKERERDNRVATRRGRQAQPAKPAPEKTADETEAQ